MRWTKVAEEYTVEMHTPHCLQIWVQIFLLLLFNNDRK